MLVMTHVAICANYVLQTISVELNTADGTCCKAYTNRKYENRHWDTNHLNKKSWAAKK